MLKFRWGTEFKQTEMGEVPKEWEETELERIISDIQKGVKPKKLQSEGRLLPYLSAEYLRGETEATDMFTDKAGVSVNENEVIVLWDGSNAGEVFKGKKGLLSSTMAKLTPNESMSALFLFYSLKLREDELRDTTTGTGIPHVDKQKLLNIRIFYPSPDEQSCIATILSWFDDLIENKKHQNEILEETAKAIFKSWFIDFEPFKGKSFVDSELRKIPKGWEVKPIGELAKLRNGLSYSGKEKFEDPVEGSYIFITLNNAIEGGGFKSAYAWIKSDRIKEHHFLEEGDLIIPNTEQTKDERLLGSPGVVIFPPYYEGQKGVYSHHITKISPFDQKHRLLLYLFLRFTREDSASFATGTGVLGMDIDNFKINKLVIIPPQPILEKFHSLAEPLFQKIITNQKQIMTLRKVRDTLLPLLIFGKLRVERV